MTKKTWVAFNIGAIILDSILGCLNLYCYFARGSSFNLLVATVPFGLAIGYHARNIVNEL